MSCRLQPESLPLPDIAELIKIRKSINNIAQYNKKYCNKFEY